MVMSLFCIQSKMVHQGDDDDDDCKQCIFCEMSIFCTMSIFCIESRIFEMLLSAGA